MQGQPAYSIVVEDGTERRKEESRFHLLYSCVVTLSLGVLGSTVLPVPYAFSKLGVFGGSFTAALVGLANDLTCTWLIRAAAVTGRYTYEGLAEFAGGHRAKLVTQVSLVVLLFGTISGGMAFLADMGRIMATLCLNSTAGPHGLHDHNFALLDGQAKGVGLSELTAVADTLEDPATGSALPLGLSAPALAGWKGWMLRLAQHLQQDGRPVMVTVVAFVLYPLSLRRHIRALEKAATLGVGVVLMLVGLIVTKAITSGMPAIRNGELPLGWGAGGLESLPEGFAILGFAFYMQPMLMPLLSELPEGPEGVKVSETAVHLVLWVVACGVYGSMGLFGAATYGASTAGNIMLNNVLGNAPMAVALGLNIALLLYLCTGMVTSVHALRASVDVALMGESAPFAWGRWVTETTVMQAAALAVAYTFPTAAEKIFALTGCTAVCVVCYCVPVYVHLILKSRLHSAAVAAGVPLSPYVTREMSHAACSQDGDALFQPLMDGPQATEASEPGSLQPPLPDNAATGPPESAAGVGAGNLQQQPLLHSNQRAAQPECSLEELYDPHRAFWQRALSEWLLPVLVVAVGVACSLAGLFVSIRDLTGGLEAANAAGT